jgi:hypothetical protein
MPPKKDDKKKGKGDADKQLLSKSLRVTYQASCKALDVKPLKKLQLDMQKAEEDGLKLVDRIAAQDYSARTLTIFTRTLVPRSPFISPFRRGVGTTFNGQRGSWPAEDPTAAHAAAKGEPAMPLSPYDTQQRGSANARVGRRVMQNDVRRRPAQRG